MAVSAERKAYLKEWRKTDKARTYQRGYQKEYCKTTKYKVWRKKHRFIDAPWMRFLGYVQGRVGGKNYPNYKGRIKNFLTPEIIKMLWFRDKAYLMEQPSIDRKDSNGDYVVDNCRFIELVANRAQGPINRLNNLQLPRLIQL